MYRGLLALHILAAVVWVGGAITAQVLAGRVLRAGDNSRMAALAGDLEWMGLRVYTPSSVIVLVAGIGLVLEGGWGFGHFWILFGLAVLVLSAITGMVFLGPESGRIGKVVAEHGVDHPEAQARIRRILTVARVEAVLLVLVVIDMAAKPGA